MPVSSAQRLSRSSPGESEIPPGPNAGRVWRDAPATHCDPISGRIVTRLTSYRGHSHHLAGAAPCWLDEGRQLLLVSDREGCGNLFAYDFAAGALTQLTDLRGDERPGGAHFTGPLRLGFRYGAAFYEVELDSLRMREVRPRAIGRARSATGATARVGEIVSPAQGRIVWLAPGGAGGGKRVLAVTGGSGLAPFAIAAPCVRPGQEQVVFVSDASGYAQIYVVDASSPAELPRLTALTRARRRAGAASGPRPTSPPA